ncbi:ER membrane protein complex subunit 5-like [Physella acuta]|uniref:ER membrane protein complex subunit 5-like n=1 Tax=Physella acuta TaxID=109671 RepID=UPI0027DBF681|nr:ER membrane protein complex subunit 5-like [Physella acuta]
MAVHKMCVVLGLVALAHAAYSAAQHRTYLRLTEQEFTMLPPDIFLQCALGLLITCYGVVNVAGNFKEIKASAEQDNKTWEMLANRQGFNIFHHRGKALFQRRTA